MLDGYQLSLTELTGAYGVDTGYVVLAKGNAREIIWTDEEREYIECPDGRERMFTSVGIFRSHIELGQNETLKWNYSWPNKWAEHVVESYKVWCIDEFGNRDWYTESFDEALAARMKHLDRALNYRAVDAIECREFEMTDALLRIVRKVSGFKSAKRGDVRVSKFPKKWDGATGCYYRIQNTRTGTIAEL